MSQNQITGEQAPEEEMSFLDHLEQLRWHFIRSSVAIVVLGVVAFINKKFKSFINKTRKEISKHNIQK